VESIRKHYSIIDMSDGMDARLETNAYLDFARGDFSQTPALLAGLEGNQSDEARAHAFAIRAHLWFADLPGGELPDPAALRTTSRTTDAQPAALRAWVLLQQARLLAFELEPALGAATEAAMLDGLDAASAIRRDFVQLAWEASQPDRSVTARLTMLFDQAKGIGLAALTIDIQSLLGLALLVRGELGQATMVARRASRMARTEGFPQQQYMANLLLARVRRLSGVPHLATHILRALATIAPSPYQGWIRWERVLAGTLSQGNESTSSSAGRAAIILESVFEAAINGEPEALRASSEALLQKAREVPMIWHETQDLCVALDAERPLSQASEPMNAWIRGESALPPHGLYGVTKETGEEPTAERDVGYVLVEPGRQPRRVLGLAKPTSGAALFDDGRQTDRRKSRVETGLAVLALASLGPLEDRAFFRQVYGFEFNPAVHPAVLDALVSRMRKALGEAGRLNRDTGRLQIEFSRSAALPDPRCAQPVEERILRVLVRAQDGSAKDAAARLGLPLRTIQEALRELTEDGACIKRRDGRKIAYIVEDTTFAPPTQSGVSPRS
jgi:DNA-binding transcriptional ArsR family regulator